MTTVAQLRAARALLHLKTPDITAAIGMLNSTLSRVECEKTTPQRSTIFHLQKFYEERGVEFGPDGWVRLRPVVEISGDSQMEGFTSS